MKWVNTERPGNFEWRHDRNTCVHPGCKRDCRYFRHLVSATGDVILTHEYCDDHIPAAGPAVPSGLDVRAAICNFYTVASYPVHSKSGDLLGFMHVSEELELFVEVQNESSERLGQFSTIDDALAHLGWTPHEVRGKRHWMSRMKQGITPCEVCKREAINYFALVDATSNITLQVSYFCDDHNTFPILRGPEDFAF